MSARGELVVVEERRGYTVAPTYSVELVKSVRRDGTPLRTVYLSWFNYDGRYADLPATPTECEDVFVRQTTSRGRKVDRLRCYATGTTYRIDAAAFDTASAWAALHERHNADAPWSPGSFTTLDDVKGFLSPFRMSTEQAA